jgi:hypothetical protein
MESEISPTEKFMSLLETIWITEDTPEYHSAVIAVQNFLDTDEAKNSSSVQAEARMAGF